MSFPLFSVTTGDTGGHCPLSLRATGTLSSVHVCGSQPGRTRETNGEGWEWGSGRSSGWTGEVQVTLGRPRRTRGLLSSTPVPRDVSQLT